jgi:RimJ/RimL family protein N-acetyltransferase
MSKAKPSELALCLRKLDKADAETLVSWIANERELLAWGGPYFDAPLSCAAIQNLIKEHKGQNPPRECWAGTNADGEFVATFQLTFNYRSGQAGLGRVLIKPEYRGGGLARERLCLAEQLAFRRPEINRLELRVFTFNFVAISAYERAGFITEGIARETARFGDSYWDIRIMSKLRSEREDRTA